MKGVESMLELGDLFIYLLRKKKKNRRQKGKIWWTRLNKPPFIIRFTPRLQPALDSYLGRGSCKLFMWWYQWERWERLDGWNKTPETLGPSGQDQAGTGRIGASQKKQEGLSGGWRIPKPLTKTGNWIRDEVRNPSSLSVLEPTLFTHSQVPFSTFIAYCFVRPLASFRLPYWEFYLHWLICVSLKCLEI